MSSPTPRPTSASTEQMSAIRSPSLAETLPPSGLLNLQRQPVAAPVPSSTPTEPAVAAPHQLDRLSALVEREVRKLNPAPVSKSSSLSGPSAAPAPSAPATSDEEPLETYLDRFMERLTGKKPEATESVAQTVPGMPVFPRNLAEAPAPAASPVPAAPPPREPTKPPECRETLSAMRELANENARSAVAHHASIDLSGRAKLALVAAAGFSLFSCGLASAAILMNSRACLWSSAVAGCLAAIVACRFFLLCRQFRPAHVYE